MYAWFNSAFSTVILTLFLVVSSASSANTAGQGAAAEVAQRGDSYADLVSMFEEFRASGDATNSVGVPDYSAPAVAERYQVLQQFRRCYLEPRGLEPPLTIPAGRGVKGQQHHMQMQMIHLICKVFFLKSN